MRSAVERGNMNLKVTVLRITSTFRFSVNASSACHFIKRLQNLANPRVQEPQAIRWSVYLT